jgi:hypothetical protein
VQRLCDLQRTDGALRIPQFISMQSLNRNASADPISSGSGSQSDSHDIFRGTSYSLTDVKI